MRNVSSLTDHLLKTHYDEKIRELSAVDAANQTQSIISYRIENMTDAALCYAPVKETDGQYQLPEIDIEKMTSIGVAMAMLIISTMQNEEMLDTQLEGVKGTQNQKLSASNTTILKIRQQYRKKHFKSAFQKFMEWLNDTWLMKFLNSNYGKAIMFLIGAAVTIASFGTAGPAVIMVSVILLGCQATELVLGKSMGELLTQGMDDGAAKMALQMSIDIGLMLADTITGNVAGGKAATEAMEQGVKVVDKAGDVAKQAQEISKQVAEISEKLGSAADQMTDISKQIDKLQETVKNVESIAQKVTKGVEEGVSSAADVLEQGQKLQKEMQNMMEQVDNLKTALNNLKATNIDNVDLVSKIDDITGSIESLAKKAQKGLDAFKVEFENYLSKPAVKEALKDSFEEVTEKMESQIDDLTETLNSKKEKLQKALDSLEAGSQQRTKAEDAIKNINEQIDNLENVKNGDSDSLGKLVEFAKDKNNGIDSKLVDDLADNQAIQSGITKYTGVSAKKGSTLAKVGSKIKAGARFVAGMRGLEHLSYFQQITLAMQKLQTRIQGFMQFYQALYSLALNEEEVRNLKISAQVDAIRVKSDAQQEFYQMMIDNQMSDIQSLLNYVKASYERAAEAIKEYGETNLSIARNLVI